MHALRLSLAALALAQPAYAAAPATPAHNPTHEFRFDTHAIEAQAHELARAFSGRAAQMLAQLGTEFPFGDAAALAFVAGEVGGTRDIVKNAPYSAEAVSETVQVLADGNRIVREARTLLARDAQGRTRQEKRGPRGTRIYLFDPVADKSYVLNPERKTAVALPRVPAPPVPPVPPVPPLPGTSGSRIEVAPGQVIVRRSNDGDGKDVHVQVVRIARGEDVPLAPPSLLSLPLLPKGKGETKALGTRDFGGVTAEGTMTTHTIPAGTIGNEKPIVASSERWFAPDLHIVVYAQSSDPRSGITTYKLANLRREDPPADWFKVPADYKVVGERR